MFYKYSFKINPILNIQIIKKSLIIKSNPDVPFKDFMKRIAVFLGTTREVHQVGSWWNHPQWSKKQNPWYKILGGLAFLVTFFGNEKKVREENQFNWLIKKVREENQINWLIKKINYIGEIE